jgi:Flp pilus assembly protein TadG
MTLARFYRAPMRSIRRLVDEQQGASAIEFALLLPLMLTLYISGVEISQAVGADRKVTLISHTVADLIAQTSVSLSSTDVGNALAAAGAIVTPYSASNLRVIVSQIKIDANGNATIDWSQATPANIARTKGAPVTLDPLLNNASTWGTCLIWGETTYGYTPQLGYAITGTLNLSDQIYLAPRLKTCVTYTG